MKPPRCCVCDLNLHDIDGELDARELGDYFALIYFGETEADKLRESRAMGHVGVVGHPSNAVWFCTDHAHLGREHEDMPVKEALAAIGKLTGSPPMP